MSETDSELDFESDQTLIDQIQDSQSDQQEPVILCCIKTKNRNNVCVRSPTLNCTLITVGIIVSLVIIETILLESGWRICRNIYSNDYDLTTGLKKNVIFSTAPLLTCRDNNFLDFSINLNLMAIVIIGAFVMLFCIIGGMIAMIYGTVLSINHELYKNKNDANLD